MIRTIVYFFTHQVWQIPLRELSPVRSFLLRQLRIFVLAVKGFADDNIQLRASALTLYTLLSIVPVLAMIFGIAKGFGFAQRLEEQLMQNFAGQKEVLDFLIDFANRMLKNTKGGVIAGVGLIVLFWSVMKVLGHVETAFNNIWQVKRARSFFRKFSDYFSLMLIAPVLVLLSSSFTVFITTYLKDVSESVTFLGFIGPVVQVIIQFTPYIITWFLFTLVYMMMPNTKVLFKSALIAGIIAGTAFQIVQWGYIHFQVYMSAYNAIYGSFAALPLFLIWLQISWLIVLFGAEISFANQNIERYEHESESLHVSHYYRRILTLWILHVIIKNFEKGGRPFTAYDIAHRLEIPIRIVREILFELSEAGILNEIIAEEQRDKAFQPAMDISAITVKFVLETLDKQGHDNLAIKDSDLLLRIKEAHAQLFETFETSSGNKLLKEL